MNINQNSVPFPAMSQKSSLISTYYASDLIPNYQEIIQNSIANLKLSESSVLEEKKEQDTGTKIESALKKNYSFFIPAIEIELSENAKTHLDTKEELEKFFSSFGEIKFIDIPEGGRKVYLLYKFYFSALYAFDTIKEILSLEHDEETGDNISKEIIIKLLNEDKEENESKMENNKTPTKLRFDKSPAYIPKKYLNGTCNYKTSSNQTNSASPPKTQEEKHQSENPLNFYYPPSQCFFNPFMPGLFQPSQYINPYSNYFPQFAKNTYKFSTYSSREYTFKYVCNYEVQIENDEKFNVTKRIIGQNGLFLKKIIYDTCIIYGDYSTKVRLRGKGSGYKEGEELKESEEPLQLCVSSLNYPTYINCCKMIENLLNKVYFDYSAFTGETEMKRVMKYEFVVNRFTG